MGPALVLELSHDLASTVDPIGTSLFRIGDIDRGKRVPILQKTTETRPAASGLELSYDLTGIVDPKGPSVTPIWNIDRRKNLTIFQKTMDARVDEPPYDLTGIVDPKCLGTGRI